MNSVSFFHLFFFYYFQNSFHKLTVCFFTHTLQKNHISFPQARLTGSYLLLSPPWQRLPLYSSAGINVPDLPAERCLCYDRQLRTVRCRLENWWGYSIAYTKLWKCLEQPLISSYLASKQTGFLNCSRGHALQIFWRLFKVSSLFAKTNH